MKLVSTVVNSNLVILLFKDLIFCAPWAENIAKRLALPQFCRFLELAPVFGVYQLDATTHYVFF